MEGSGKGQNSRSPARIEHYSPPRQLLELGKLQTEMTGGGHHQNEWIRFSDREFIVEAFAWVFPSPTFALVNRLGARGWWPGSHASVPQRHYLDAVPIAKDSEIGRASCRERG